MCTAHDDCKPYAHARIFKPFQWMRCLQAVCHCRDCGYIHSHKRVLTEYILQQQGVLLKRLMQTLGPLKNISLLFEKVRVADVFMTYNIDRNICCAFGSLTNLCRRQHRKIRRIRRTLPRLSRRRAIRQPQPHLLNWR